MFQGYVALLDVLGFSSLVSGGNEDTRLHRYLDCLQTALADEEDGHPVEYIVFSDSITLTTKNDSDESLQALISGCSRIFGLMLQEEIPLRGAIAHGSFLRITSAGGLFVAGKAVIDAYTFETKQNWVGIMLAPSALKMIPDLAERCGFSSVSTPGERSAFLQRLRWAAFVQPCAQIPFQSSSPFVRNNFQGFAIVPTFGLAEPVSIRDSLSSSLSKLEWLKSLAPDPLAQDKYSSCLLWLRQIERSWNDVVYGLAMGPQATASE